MTLLEHLRAHPFLLAPMAGITDSAFRSYMKELGAGIVISELISATGIKYQSQKTQSMVSFREIERPVGIQLFGEEPETLAEAAKWVEAQGATFVDLNFGCPVPKVVKKGGGSAMLKDPLRLREVLRSVKRSISIPLTIKIRTGWDDSSRNGAEICQIAYDEGVTWVAIHGRTRAQGYSGLADWEFIKQIKSISKIPIIGNGDILTDEEAVHRLRESGCDGVMIGRGALKNPWIFVEALHLHQEGTLNRRGSGQALSRAFRRLDFYLSQLENESVHAIQLKKFAAWYSAGYPGSSNFRKSLFQTSQIVDLLKLIDDYFMGVDFKNREDQRQESFLMGGHG